MDREKILREVCRVIGERRGGVIFEEDLPHVVMDLCDWLDLLEEAVDGYLYVRLKKNKENKYGR